MQIFDKARVQAAELIQDATSFLTEKFSQAGKVFSVSSAYGQLLNVLAKLQDMNLFFIEDSVTEQNIYTASRTQSIQGLARLAGHNATRAVAATGEIQLNVTKTPEMNGNQIIIPNFSRIKCLNNNQVYTINLLQEEMRLNTSTSTSYYAQVMQGEISTQVFTGTGTPLQSYVIMTKSNQLVDNFFVKVYVNGELWNQYDSILDMPRLGKGYLIKTGISGGIDLYFGNDNMGMKPALGSEIRVEYLVTGGEIGNLREIDDVIFQWVDNGYSQVGEDVDLNDSITVKMSKLITFGSNPEPTFLTRLIAPHQSRSFVLANPTNYVIFLQKFNYFSVVHAYNTFDDQYLDDDNVVYLFLIPDITKRLKTNENYFTVPQQYFALTEQEKDKVLDVIENSQSKIVSTVAKIVDPIIRKYVINIHLIVFEGFSQDLIKNQIIDAMSAYFLGLRRRDRIPKSDLIKIIENLDGVDSVNVSFVSEQNEISKKSDSNAEVVGLDSFGDIVISQDELPIVRGGWNDRNGMLYNDSVSATPGSVNIMVDRVTPRTVNTQLFEETVKTIMKK